MSRRVSIQAIYSGEIEEDGTWRLEMEGHIIIRWRPRNEFEKRVLLMLFRQVRTPQSTPKRPLLRQEWLAEWFKTYQEWISRWQRYVRQGGLEKLKGAHEGWVLTPEMRRTILEIWAPNFWLSTKAVRERLLAAGHIASSNDISIERIHEVARESGFAEVRRLLRQVLVFSAEGPQWRDNPSCSFGTFTDYPQQVRLYAEWTVDTMLWGVMVYMHLRTTYRRAADVGGVSSVTLWRWTMAVGEHTLPLAQLFGMVRSSGVIGVDEKWVLVPKNSKPEGKRKRWMYVRLWRCRGCIYL